MTMKLTSSAEYENFGAEFQYQVIKMLNEALKAQKVKKKEREEICGDFSFNFSMLLDQGKIKGAMPIVTFKKGNKLLLNNGGFEYHEYSYGNVDEVFNSK